MLTQKKREYYSKVLGFKNLNEFEEFSKRYLKYLEQEKLTKNRIMAGFFILLEIQKQSLQNRNIINLEGIKNPHIKKYSQEILDLRKKGLGSQAIIKHLYENHRVKVSRGTVEKFYKINAL